MGERAVISVPTDPENRSNHDYCLPLGTESFGIIGIIAKPHPPLAGDLRSLWQIQLIRMDWSETKNPNCHRKPSCPRSDGSVQAIAHEMLFLSITVFPVAHRDRQPLPRCANSDGRPCHRVSRLTTASASPDPPNGSRLATVSKSSCARSWPWWSGIMSPRRGNQPRVDLRPTVRLLGQAGMRPTGH